MDKKPDKQTKFAINYFTKTDTLRIVGVAVLAAGLISLAFGIGIAGYILACIGTPTGIILFIIGTSNKASDADMDADIERKLNGLSIDIDSDRHYYLKLLNNQKDITIEGYRFTDGVMIKKLKDGSQRTSVFTRTKLRILSDRLYIVSRDVYLIENDVHDHIYELEYGSITDINIISEEKRVVFNNTVFFTKPCNLVIQCGSDRLEFPIINAVTSDKLVDNIKRQMKIYEDGNA